VKLFVFGLKEDVLMENFGFNAIGDFLAVCVAFDVVLDNLKGDYIDRHLDMVVRLSGTISEPSSKISGKQTTLRLIQTQTQEKKRKEKKRKKKKRRLFINFHQATNSRPLRLQIKSKQKSSIREARDSHFTNAFYT